MILNIYPQDFWHGDLLIAGEAAALERLSEGLEQASINGESELMGLMESDGTSFGVKILVCNQGYASRLMMPYFGDFNLSEGEIMPWENCASLKQEDQEADQEEDEQAQLLQIYPPGWEAGNGGEHRAWIIGSRKALSRLSASIKLATGVEHRRDQMKHAGRLMFYPADLVNVTIVEC